MLAPKIWLAVVLATHLSLDTTTATKAKTELTADLEDKEVAAVETLVAEEINAVEKRGAGEKKICKTICCPTKPEDLAKKDCEKCEEKNCGKCKKVEWNNNKKKCLERKRRGRNNQLECNKDLGKRDCKKCRQFKWNENKEKCVKKARRGSRRNNENNKCTTPGDLTKKECKKCERLTWKKNGENGKKCVKIEKGQGRNNKCETKEECKDCAGMKWNTEKTKCKKVGRNKNPPGCTKRTCKKKKEGCKQKCKAKKYKWGQSNRNGNNRNNNRCTKKKDCLKPRCENKGVCKTLSGGKSGDDRAATINLTCLTAAVTYTKFLKDNVQNFFDRNTRLKKQNDLSTKKGNKKGEFVEPAARLIQAGGGDKSNLSCGGSTANPGAKQLLNLTNRLSACTKNIMDNCAPPKMNQTKLDTCFTNAKAFNTTVSSCIFKALKGEDACSCFQASAVASEKKVLESCKGKTEAQAAAAQRTKCLKVVRSCNQDSDEAGKLQYSCKYTKKELMETLAKILKNNATLSKTLAKIQALTGVKANLPGPGSNSSGRAVRDVGEDDYDDKLSIHERIRGKRGDDGGRQAVTCASLITLSTTCGDQIANAPASPKVLTACATPTVTTTVTCTTTETTSLQTSLDILLVKNIILIAFAFSIQSEIKAQAGATLSPTELTVLAAGGTSGTAASSGRNRNILRKLIMDKLQKTN